MEPFFWKPSHDTSLGEIDRDHRIILELANELYLAINDQKGREAILSTCQRIVNFTEDHFSKEEKYMEMVNYPGIKMHQLEHMRLREEARNFLLKLECETPGVDTGIYHVLKELFLEHIPKFDKPFGQYFLSRMLGSED